MRANVIRAGELRSFITIYIRKDETDQDTTGHVEQLNSATALDGWQIRAADVPAKIYSMRGTETIEGKRDISKLYEEITIRYDPDTIPAVTDAIVSDEGKRYEILGSFDPTKRREMISIPVREVN